MKQYFITLLAGYFLLSSNSGAAQVTTTTTTTSNNGKARTQTVIISGNGQAITLTGNDIIDTAIWKTRTVSKDFNITSGVPIYIESAYRAIEIKTWDQPNVRIVANTVYKNDKDTMLSFAELFEKNGISIKNNDQSFEILGAANNNTSYGQTYSFSYPDNYTVKNGFSADRQIAITTPDYFYTENGDTVLYRKDSAGTHLRLSFRSADDMKAKSKLQAQAEAMNKAIDEKNKKTEDVQKTKIAALSKKIEILSQKLAVLTQDNAAKNNSEITEINQEIGRLSNQIAFLSAGNPFIIKLDTAKVKWNTFKSIPLPPVPSGISFSPVVSSSTPNSLKWTIYIPKNHKISIDSRYGNINIDDDLTNAKIVSRYGNIETKNIDNLIVRNEYGSVYTNNVKDADIELRGGKLKMQNVGNLKIDSKNTSVDLNEAGNITMESSNDNYDVSSVRDLNVNKNYGSFRLTTLNGKMNFNGINADIKIRNIAPTVTSIDITNKFAKIALPFSDVKNYSITVNGTFNSSFDDFNKSYDQQGTSSYNKGFSATGGNGKDLKTSINCNYCQLDFK